MKKPLQIKLSTKEINALDAVACHKHILHDGRPNRSATIGALATREAGRINAARQRQKMKLLIEEVRATRPKYTARSGSTWWLTLDDGVAWTELPRGREPFEERCINMGQRVLPSDLDDDFTIAMYGLVD
jgi:hypothetical protein